MKYKMLFAVFFLFISIALVTSCNTMPDIGEKVSEAASRVRSDIWPSSKGKEKVSSETAKRLEAIEEQIKGEEATSDKTGTVIASGHPEYPPVTWQEGGDIVGLGTEILKMIFEDSQITVESAYQGSWLEVQEKAKSGDIDIIAGIYITEERKAFLAYSIPFMKDTVVIFVAKDKTFPFAKWDDLIGKRGTTTVGDSFGLDFDRFIAAKLTVTRSATTEENFKKLVSGEADYFICAMYLGLFEAEKLGISGQIEYLPTYATADDFYIAVSKRSKYRTFLPEINQKLEKLLKDGAVEKLIDEKTKRYKETAKEGK